jgi:hypothetical protein
VRTYRDMPLFEHVADLAVYLDDVAHDAVGD